ncbi:hypothetical protein [Lederbergia graminis]|uniref:Uncharacterized protein n=1 Tax=Lederbergia graminis TaxID=735518 RepID=A0ABW0LI60_9BACI
MSSNRKGKEIHVENLIIHAKNVEIIEDDRDRKHDRPRRNPWDSFWGRGPFGNQEDNDNESSDHR